MKKVHINMCPILDGYGVMTVFNSRTRPHVNSVYSWRGHVISTLGCNVGKVGVGWYLPGVRAVHNRAAACVAAGGDIFENQL